MINYNKTQAVWTSGACPPEGVYMDRSYSILKKNDNLYITDGNIELLFDKFCITTFLSPQNKDVTWEQVDFSDEVVQKK